MLRRGGKRIRMDDPPEDYEPPFTPYSVQPQTPMDQQRFKSFLNIARHKLNSNIQLQQQLIWWTVRTIQ